MSCKACDWIEKEKLIYQDDKVVAILSDEPANFGHVLVMPKQHYTILEQVPDDIIGHIGSVSNKLSIALFETLNIQGTNLIIHNGVSAHQTIPHLLVHIIPRLDNDGIDFSWKPRRLSEEEMSTIELELTEESKAEKEVISSQLQPRQIQTGSKSTEPEKIKESKETNYLIRQLERLP